MYELKTLLPEFQIQLPNTMYAMKNLQATTNSSSSSMNGGSNNICNSSNDVGAIILRQDQVLQQLNDLKSQLSEIRSTLGVCQKGPQHNTSLKMATNAGNNGGLREEPLHDIVINGHPNFIPYALLALKNAWQNDFDILVKCFTHSTMADIGAEARKFEAELQTTTTTAGNKPKINVTLIWKNCEHTEMISSPTMYVPIYGEVNIIRYLGRIGPAAYRYENSKLCNEIDLVLDICYQLLRCKSSAAMLRALNERLAKQQYFGGDSMSVADIGVHSSLKRLPKLKDKELTPALLAWRKRVELITRI